MPIQVTGSQAVVVQLAHALSGLAPGYTGLRADLAELDSLGAFSYARDKAKALDLLPDAVLANAVLANLGIAQGTVAQSSYSSLLAALTTAFDAFPTDRGVVVLNLTNLLAGLEANSAWGGAAKAFNDAVAADYSYSLDQANTAPKLSSLIAPAPAPSSSTSTSAAPAPAPSTSNSSTPAPAPTSTPAPAGAPAPTPSPAPSLSLTSQAGEKIVGTAGNDSILARLQAANGSFVQTLQSGDAIDGGAGTDTLDIQFNGMGAYDASLATVLQNGGVVPDQLIAPVSITNVERLVFSQLARDVTTLDLSNASGIAEVSAYLAMNGGTLNLNSLNSSLQRLTLQFFSANLNVNSTASAIAGSSDTIQLSLDGASVGLGLAGYENVNVTSGALDNTVRLAAYAPGSKWTVTGDKPLGLWTGASSDAIVVDASALTNNAALKFEATGSSKVKVTGSSGADTFILGGLVTGDGSTPGRNGYSSGDSIDGGGGYDVLQLVAAAITGVGTQQTNLANIEEVQVLDRIQAQTIGGLPVSATLRPGFFGGAKVLTLASATSNPFTVNFEAGASTLNLKAPVSGNVSVTAFAGSAAGNTLTINSAGGSTGALFVDGFGSATLNGTGLPDAFNTVRLSSPGARLNIGGQGTTINFVAADTIDGSAATGAITLRSVEASTVGSAVQVTGGAGNDSLVGTVYADVIAGGAGNDRIQIAGAQQGDVVTGGAGADTFVLYGTYFPGFDARALLLQTSAGTSQLVRITDFTAGIDKIGLVAGGFTSVSLGAQQTLASASDIAGVWAGITSIAGSTTTQASAAVVVVSGGAAAGTYLYVNDGSSTVSSSTDMLVNLTGMTGVLSTADFVFS